MGMTTDHPVALDPTCSRSRRKSGAGTGTGAAHGGAACWWPRELGTAALGIKALLRKLLARPAGPLALGGELSAPPP
jgi:hypothetical protein